MPKASRMPGRDPWNEDELNMKELLYGTAYDLGDVPEYRVERDLMLMKQAGMNVIRITQPDWSVWEPQEGIYDFALLDRMLDAADAANISVIVEASACVIPSWLKEKDPDVMGMGAAPGERMPGSSGQSGNHRRSILRFYVERLLRRITTRAARHSCVIGYQIGGGIDASSDLPDEQHRDVEEALAWESAVVSACKRPEQFITHSFDFLWEPGAPAGTPGSSSPCEAPYAGSRSKSAQYLTTAGCAVYHPTQDDLTGMEIAYSGDSARSLQRDNYFVVETQAQGFPLWTPYPGQLRLQAYSHLASGADLVGYGHWHSFYSGPDAGWSGVLGHDLEPGTIYGEVCLIGTEWKHIGHKLVHLQKDNRVALVVDPRCLEALDRDLAVPGCSYREIVRWLYDSLYRVNIECDIVELDEVDTTAYRMILTPALYSVAEQDILKLRKFVDNGGVLVSTFQSFFADAQMQVYPERKPYFMTDVFGMYYQMSTAPGGTTVGGQPVENIAELVFAQDAEVLSYYQHKYWDRYAAATRNHYSLGRAYYIACMMERSVLGRILLEAAADAGIITEAMDFEWPVIVRSGVNEYGSRIHYVLHYSEEERDIVCPYEATELLREEEYHIGDVLHLKDWDVRILEEKQMAEDRVTIIE